MDGVVRQLYDYDGSNLFPRTKPAAFVSNKYDSSATGITTIGELIDTSVPGDYIDPATTEAMSYEPEFVYRIPATDREITGSPTGTLKAIRLTDVSALHFDAKLAEDLTVTNPVGQATLNRTYPAGTLLETIIIDMLTGGISVKDIERILPGVTFVTEVSLDGITYQEIINGQTITADVGSSSLKVRYKFIFTDGKYKPSAGYDTSLFILRNVTDAPENAPYFVNDNPPYLIGGCSPTYLSLTDSSNNIYYSENYPASDVNKTTTLATVTSGSKLYIITVNYSAAISVPRKSDGNLSGLTIDAGTRTFQFTINGVQVNVYYADPVIPNMALENYWTGILPSGSDIPTTLPDEAASFDSDNYAFEVRSGYDITNNTSTGVWSGDSVQISTKRYFNSAISSRLVPEAAADFYNSTAEAVQSYGPYFGVLSTGHYKPGNNYTASSFVDHNPTAVTNEFSYPCVVAGCSYSMNPTVKLCKYINNAYVETAPIAIATLPYGNADNKVILKPLCVNTNKVIEYYATVNYKDSLIIDTGSSVITNAGDYGLVFTFPYGANSVTAKNSDDSNATAIAAGEMKGITKTFAVNQEVDVSTTAPSISIESITVTNYGSFNNDDTINLVSDAPISGQYNFVVHNKEGLFTPKSGYTQAEFNTNNNTSGGELGAGCQFSTFTLKKGSTVIGTCPGSSIDSTGHGSISFSNLPVTGIASFTVQMFGVHSASNVTAKKRSARPSSEHINANSALGSNNFKLNVAQPETYTISLKAEPRQGGTVRFSTNPIGSDSDTSVMQQGASYTAIAAPAANYTFSNWTDGYGGTVIGTSTTYNGTATADKTLVANFVSSASPYTARLLTTSQIIDNGTGTLLSNITTVNDILSRKLSGTDEWNATVPSTLSSDTSYGINSTMHFGWDGMDRTVVALVPAGWTLSNIELEHPYGRDNGFFGTNGFDTNQPVGMVSDSSNNTYKVYAKMNFGASSVDVDNIVYKI